MIDDPEKLAKIGPWMEAQRSAAYWKDEEMRLRKEIFSDAFPAPLEGVNREELPGGWQIKATHKVNRSLDKAALPAVLQKLRESNISPDALIKWNPDLSVGEYKKLTDEGRAIMDEALTIKPGSPDLELIAPPEEVSDVQS